VGWRQGRVFAWFGRAYLDPIRNSMQKPIEGRLGSLEGVGGARWATLWYNSAYLLRLVLGSFGSER
jgi:hypothetical protein